LIRTETVLGATAAATAGGTAALVGVPAAVSAVGFTSTGIAANSIAAAWMSATAIASGTGGVASGSAIAILQSVGAAGMGMIALPVALGGGAIGLATYGGYRWWSASRSPSPTINQQHCINAEQLSDFVSKEASHSRVDALPAPMRFPASINRLKVSTAQ
jgi:hypothetical protein